MCKFSNAYLESDYQCVYLVRTTTCWDILPPVFGNSCTKLQLRFDSVAATFVDSEYSVMKYLLTNVHCI